MTGHRLEEGQYFYKPFGRRWGVWQVGKEVNGCRTNPFVRDFPTKEEAREYVREREGRQQCCRIEDKDNKKEQTKQ